MERLRQLLREAAQTRLEILRALALPVVQTSVAATLAWVVAHDLIGHPNAFFAPIAATVAIGLAAQQYIRRVGELMLGVAVGIAVADAIVSGIGTGTWQLGVVVLVSMAVAAAIGGGPLFITQAAVQAILVATLPGSNTGSRFVDALVGGAIGLAILIASPPNPVRRARREATTFFAALAVALDEIAAALERRDVAAAREALAHARAVEPVFRRWVDSLRAGREKATVSPPYWQLAAPARPLRRRVGASRPRRPQCPRPRARRDPRGGARPETPRRVARGHSLAGRRGEGGRGDARPSRPVAGDRSCAPGRRARERSLCPGQRPSDCTRRRPDPLGRHRPPDCTRARAIRRGRARPRPRRGGIGRLDDRLPRQVECGN